MMENKISIVITGRNDNYDGNFDERLCTALGRNLQSLPKAEFIYVEWNPFLDRPLSSERLKKVFGDRIIYYVAHPKFNDEYCTIDGFLEYPAKNVGVRRSTGNFIICTNSDVIFAPELVTKLNNNLNPRHIYRAVRVDIPANNLNVKFPLDKKLEENKGLYNASGDFLMLDRNTWIESTGYCEEFPGQRLHKDAYLVYLLTELRKFPVTTLGYVTHWRHPSSWANGEIRPKVGDVYWDFKTCGYTKNKPTWGLSFAKEIVKDGITWLE